MALPPVSARGGTRKLPRHPEAAQLSNTLLRGCSVAWLQQMETLGVDDIETAREDALTEGDELRAIRIMEYALFVRSRSDEMSERGLAEYFEELTTSYNSLAMENVEAVRHRHCLSLVFPPLFFAKTVPFLAVLQGNYPLSQELLRKAEFVTEQRDVLVNHDIRMKLRAITLNNMGCLYRRRGKLHAAVKFLEKALRIEQTLSVRVVQNLRGAPPHLQSRFQQRRADTTRDAIAAPRRPGQHAPEPLCDALRDGPARDRSGPRGAGAIDLLLLIS